MREGVLDIYHLIICININMNINIQCLNLFLEFEGRASEVVWCKVVEGGHQTVV